jgi:hypothetical protein
MSNIKLFESQKIRSHWDAEKEKWYFSVTDVIQVLTDSNNPRRYWSDLKQKLEQEGFFQLYAIIVQLKMMSQDGKKYVTDCTDTEGLLRIIQGRTLQTMVSQSRLRTYRRNPGPRKIH